jgi:P4 family phage/plasmid primase-like protien
VRGGKKGPIPLKLSDTAIKGAVKAASAFATNPGFFNDAPAGICFTNGFVVIEGGRAALIPHAPSQRTMHSMPFEFLPSGRAPRWVQFLEEVFSLSSEEDRADKIALLQEQAGAALLGMATRYSTCLVLTGEGSNGKSVYLQVIKALFPAGSTASIAPQLWENRFYLAELAGVRLNAVAELPDRDILDSEAFKAMVSGDATMVARKNQRPFNLVPIAAHLLACNALPGTKDQSNGFWRRFAVVPFDRTFADAERDSTLADTLIRTELPGIAAWAIEGAARLERQGKYTTPDSSTAAKDEWQMDSDQVRQFIAECTTPGGQTNPTKLYEAFAQWAKRTGHAGMNLRKFGGRVSKILRQARNTSERYDPVAIRPEWTASREGWR